jgi:hypothetical protein
MVGLSPGRWALGWDHFKPFQYMRERNNTYVFKNVDIQNFTEEIMH